MSTLSPVWRPLCEESKVTETPSQVELFHEIEDAAFSFTFSKKKTLLFKLALLTRKTRSPLHVVGK